MSDDDLAGLNPRNRSAIAWLVFFGLLIFGPVEPFGLEVWFAYLIAVPVAVWFALSYVGKILYIDSTANARVSRAISGVIAGILISVAFGTFTASYHAVAIKRFAHVTVTNALATT